MYYEHHFLFFFSLVIKHYWLIHFINLFVLVIFSFFQLDRTSYQYLALGCFYPFLKNVINLVVFVFVFCSILQTVIYLMFREFSLVRICNRNLWIWLMEIMKIGSFSKEVIGKNESEQYPYHRSFHL